MTHKNFETRSNLDIVTVGFAKLAEKKAVQNINIKVFYTGIYT